MRRRLFTFASALSLLLCVATVVVWLRSYWHYDLFALLRHDRAHFRTLIAGVNTHCGEAELHAGLIQFQDAPEMAYWIKSFWQTESPFHHLNCPPGIPEGRLGVTFLGFRYAAEDFKGRFERHQRFLIVPPWALAMTFAVLPIRWGLSRRARPTANACRSCAYNLTANTTGICPECGVPTKGKVGP